MSDRKRFAGNPGLGGPKHRDQLYWALHAGKDTARCSCWPMCGRLFLVSFFIFSFLLLFFYFIPEGTSNKLLKFVKTYNYKIKCSRKYKMFANSKNVRDICKNVSLLKKLFAIFKKNVIKS